MRAKLIQRKDGGENAGAMPMLIIYAEIYDKRSAAPFPFARRPPAKSNVSSLAQRRQDYSGIPADILVSEGNGI